MTARCGVGHILPIFRRFAFFHEKEKPAYCHRSPPLKHAALLANREQNRRENLTELKVILALLLGLPVSPLHISIIMGCQRFMHYRDMGAAEQRCLLKASKSTDFNRNWGLPACLLACLPACLLMARSWNLMTSSCTKQFMTQQHSSRTHIHD